MLQLEKCKSTATNNSNRQIIHRVAYIVVLIKRYKNSLEHSVRATKIFQKGYVVCYHTCSRNIKFLGKLKECPLGCKDICSCELSFPSKWNIQWL